MRKGGTTIPTDKAQKTTFYDVNGKAEELSLAPYEIRWVMA